MNIIKRLRLRFGISAPRMTVRTHVAWYWRWMGLIVILSFSFALAAWMYDAGRRFAGFDRSEVERELSQLHEEVDRLREESQQLRTVANAGESRIRIEHEAQLQLVRQVKQLESDNARLKEDLAFYENLAPAENGEGKLSVYRFKVEPDVLPGGYRYRLLVMQGGRREREQQAVLQLLVGMQLDGKDVMMTIPEDKPGGDPAYRFNFKYFHRVDGTFRVNPAARLRSVQVRVLDAGSGQVRATQNFNLS